MMSEYVRPEVNFKNKLVEDIHKRRSSVFASTPHGAKIIDSRNPRKKV